MPRYAISVVLEHGGNAHTEPQVQFARDILTFAQTHDIVGKPTAYPVKSGLTAAIPQGRLMALRAYAAAKRTLSFADKLMDVNWGLVLLITVIGLRGLCDALFGGGAAIQPLGHAPDQSALCWVVSSWSRWR